MFFQNETASTKLYTLSLHTLFRSSGRSAPPRCIRTWTDRLPPLDDRCPPWQQRSSKEGSDRKSTRLNSRHVADSYDVHGPIKKKRPHRRTADESQTRKISNIPETL